MNRTLLALIVFAAAACGSPDTAMEPVPHPVTFRLALGPEAEPPVYVQTVSEVREAAWLTLLHDGAVVAFQEQCAIPDCGAEAQAVCGAQFPSVRSLSDSLPVVEAHWDARVSVVQPDAACERLRAAPTGAWLARFCWGRGIEEAGTLPGARVVADKTCTDVPFTVPGDTVVEATVSAGGR